MKIKKRLISLVLVILMVCNYIPQGLASRGDELIISDDILDSITDITYGWTGGAYQFPDSVLIGVEEGDEVHLSADIAAVEPVEAGKKITLELTNFRFEGANVADYLLPEMAASMQKEVQVLHKKLVVRPAVTGIYYGQDLPKNNMLTELADYSDQLVGEDEVEISAQFEIELDGMEIGTYVVKQVGRLDVKGKASTNYEVEVASDLSFSIQAYEPDVDAVSDGIDGAHNGVSTATLTAPDGFLISTEGSLENEGWERSITVALEETLEGSFDYYLRNNDRKSEYYRAIVHRNYGYSSIQNMPVVNGIEITAVDSNATLHFEENAVLTNGSVQVTVYVTGATLAQDMQIILLRNDMEDIVIAVPAAEAVLEGEKYTYKAVFELPAVDGESFSYKLSAYAVTSAGTGEKYPANRSEDKFLNSDTSVAMPLVIDRKAPSVKIYDILSDGYRRLIIGDFSVSDIHSGIETVEYAWDSGAYRTFDDYVSSKTDYRIELRWGDSERVPYGRHTLHLIVRDMLGNETVCSLKAGENNAWDHMNPIIDSVSVQPAAEGTAWSCSANGLMANGTVQIIVKAHDDDSDSNSWTSGVGSVTITANDGGYTKTADQRGADGEYIFSIDPDIKLRDISITVKDKFGNTVTKGLMEAGGLPSATLYVENDAPNISLPDLGNKYEVVVWLGAAQLVENPVVTVSDGPNGISTGLKSIVVYEGETVVASQTDIPVGKMQVSIELPINGLSDGVHTFRIVAVDNCGTTSEIPYTFHKDVLKPESSKITPVEKVDVLSEENWFAPNTDSPFISFRIGANKAEDRLSRIEITVNGGEKITYTINDAKLYKIGKDQYGDCIVINTKDFDLAYHDEEGYNQYVVTAKFWDLAGNTYEDAYTIYVDKFNPTINRVVVQQKDETLVERVLRLLTFGIFSNDALTFRVYATDAEHDSGISNVTVQYSSESDPIVMAEGDDESGHYYYIHVPIEDVEKFEGTLAFKATDRFGKECVSSPFIRNENDDKAGTFYVMVEKNIPTLNFTPIAGDGYQRTDNEVWLNSNKVLEVLMRDEDSGINNISFTVNGKNVTEDKTGAILFTNPNQRELGDFSYSFDTDALVEVAGLNNDGKYDIVVRAEDNSGNVKRHEETFYVDKKAPKIDSISFKPETGDGISNVSEFIEELKYGYFFKEDFNITVNVSDEEPSSGLYAVNYRLVPYSTEGEKLQEITGTVRVSDGKAEIEVSKGFMGQIFVEVQDFVGNSTGEMTTMAYVVDSEAPSISIKPNSSTNLRDTDNKPLYTASNSFTVVITDRFSGLREFGYSKTAEKDPYDRKVIQIDENGARMNSDLGDGWIVTGVNANLVTQVTKTFTFSADDNNVTMHFDATDRATRQTKNVTSETFTIDTIAPVIQVVFRDDNDDDLYYNRNRIADITVTERNFDAGLIKVMIENTFGSVPGYSFTSKSLTEHTATINFDEGDYKFDVEGRDLGGWSASVIFTGGNEERFFVDKTAPVVQENFASFSNDKENSFTIDKTATLTITEHNFDARLTNLRIYRKAAGGEHGINGMVDVTDEILGGKQWTRNGDTYTISFAFVDDAVYYVEIAPVDLASNIGPKRNTVVFEIDKTVPVVSGKNGVPVGEDDIEFLDIYRYDRKDSENPTVAFTDLNIDHIEYELFSFIPEYKDKTDVLIQIKNSHVNGVVKGDLFTLGNFEEDGVYVLKLVAVDVAGNRSEINTNTYARMVNHDVLAFILDSDQDAQTGLFSLEYPNGDAISKKPYDFKNLRIFVMAQVDTPIDIVLRDTDGNEVLAETKNDPNDSFYGICLYTFEISAGFFREKFQEDVDKEMHLTVRNGEKRIDLAKIHIDSAEPRCDLPAELVSWKWFRNEESHTFTISNISELLDESECRIYDNGQLIPFVYSSEDDTVTFTLDKGWHNVGIILSDTAGNDYISNEVIAMHIGSFWWYFIGIGVGGLAAVGIFLILYRRKREEQLMANEK